MGQSSSPPSQSSAGSTKAPPPPPQRSMEHRSLDHPRNMTYNAARNSNHLDHNSHQEHGSQGQGLNHPGHSQGQSHIGHGQERLHSQERLHGQERLQTKTPEPQRPKTPVINVDRPKTPQVDSGKQGQPANSKPGIATSTPKVLADPYRPVGGAGGQGSLLGQQQLHMLQSKSLVPESVSRPSSYVSSKQSQSLDPGQWNKSFSDISSRSVTPPLPPLSPDNTPPATPPPPPSQQTAPPLSSSSHQHQHQQQQQMTTTMNFHQRPDVVTSAGRKPNVTTPARKKSGRGGVAVRTWDGRSKRSAYAGRASTGGGMGRNTAAMLARPRNNQHSREYSFILNSKKVFKV